MGQGARALMRYGCAMLQDEAFLAKMQQKMLNYAKKSLHTAQAADVVQETLLSALIHQDKFLHQSSASTWLFAILKHKIYDLHRQNGVDVLCDEHDDIDALFDENGHWLHAPKSDWGEPERYVQNRDFWQAFNQCLRYLPAEQARAFMLKEYAECPTHEICTQMSITKSHFYVLMHRARLNLQACLNTKGVI